MILHVLTGAPGCGKTRQMLDEMIGEPGLYLLSSPRTALCDEQAEALRSRASAATIRVHIEAVHSDQPGQRGSVARRVVDALRAARTNQETNHAVIIITHDTLIGLDPAEVAGWYVRLDEVPDTFASGSMRIPTSWSSLERHYALEAAADEAWARVVPREGVARLKPTHFIEDEARSLAQFHKAARTSNRMTVVNLATWADAARTRGAVNWWSVWSFSALAECASVRLTGASFHDSIAYHALRKFDGENVEVVVEEVGGDAQRATPSVTIYYYTKHVGTTAWWQTQEGSFCLVEISEHLKRIGFTGFWAANDVAVPYFRHRFKGVECRPKLAGTNSLRHLDSCAIFYSSKAQLSDAASLEVLGIDNIDVRRAREEEDMYQFVLRGAIRDPAYSGAYDVHVYSRDQAEALASRLRNSGIANVALVGVSEVGVMNVERPVSEQSDAAPEGGSLSPKDCAARRKAKERARGQRRRQKERDRAIAKGTYKGPGRPRKSIDRSGTDSPQAGSMD